MRIRLALLLCCLGAVAGCERRQGDERPNILLLIADDVGMAELGAFGGEIPTPNLDALAMEGVRLAAFHTAPTCSPSRAMLFTGVSSHRAGFGNMAEEMAPNQQGRPGYRGELEARTVTLSSLLQDAGYRNYFSGKWHLGSSPDTVPGSRGFARAFSLLSGGAHHYRDMRPAYAPTPDARAPFMEDGELLQALPENYDYSTQFLVDKLIAYLGETDGDERPFFAVLSFMAPHWPLQAPDAAVAMHRGNYDRGHEVLAEARLAGQLRLGLVPEDARLAPLPPGGRHWRELSPEEQRIEARAMEIYAAMVEQLDRHTGRLLEYLKRNGQLADTLVLFVSDNGPEGHDLDETWPAALFPDIRRTIDETHDFSYENMGRPGSYTLYGPNWAWAGSPALRGHKGFVTEGGIRAPAFIRWKGRLPAGAVYSGRVHITDLAPTILEAAGLTHPGNRHEGRDIEPMSGRSLLPYLHLDAARQLPDRVEVGEVMGKRYVMHYPWKAVHQPPPAGAGRWQLYNLQQDLAEIADLAARHPDRLAELEGHWRAYAVQNGVILPDRVSGY